VEQQLEREEQRPLSATEHLHSKVSTQLLRWGRCDVDGSDGIRSIHLDGWAADKWFSVDDVAEAMQVHRSDLPLAVLLSQGKHGPRVLHKYEGVQLLVKARWTGGRRQHQQEQRGNRDQSEHRRGHDQHGDRRDQGGGLHRGQLDGRRRGRGGR
jgi:hypothetical protein